MHHSQGPLVHVSGARKHRRFDLEFPVSLSFQTGEVARQLEGMSKNVSLGGVLVKASEEVPVRSRVALTIEVVGPSSRRPVRLSADGEVVRVEPLGPDSGYAVAIKCGRPMIEIKDRLNGRH